MTAPETHTALDDLPPAWRTPPPPLTAFECFLAGWVQALGEVWLSWLALFERPRL